MRKKLALAWSALAFALCAGAHANAGECAPPRLENTVPMEPIGGQGRDSGEVAVPVTLNGVEKKFLFDTGGGTMNYIAPAVALKLGMFRTDNFLATDVNGSKSYSVAGARHLTFGAITARNVMLFQVVPDLAVDGILSAGTMISDDLDMDFGAMRLNFFSPDHCPGGAVYWPHRTLAVVPVSLAQGHFELATTLDSHALTAVIDTGSPWTILNIAWAKENLGFSPEIPAPQSPGIPADEADKQIYFRKYAALSFPGITITKPLVAVRPMAELAGRRAPDIIIGMEILRHLHLYYAANEKKIYITPAATAKPPLPAMTKSSPDDHAWPQNAEAYSKVWDPAHRPH
jgi:predicted aspartyl protease